jgi:hypothetical protein
VVHLFEHDGQTVIEGCFVNRICHEESFAALECKGLDYNNGWGNGETAV